MKVCAIHQPNFFPWLGYFEKIRRSDVFVFLDAVDYPKSGNSMGSWVNRVRINVHGKAVWIRAPAVREHGPQLIRNVRIDDSSGWRDHLLKTLAINYRRAPRFDAAMALLEPLIRFQSEWLADFNRNAILAICNELGLRREFVRQSDLRVTGTGTQLLVNLVNTTGAVVYLSGDGAAGYQEDDKFAAAGIELRRLAFSPQPYVADGFLPGLSVIDFLMHREPRTLRGALDPE